MNTRHKDFDCVRMKNEIQRKLMAEQAGMSIEQRRRHMEARIAADPTLGPWFQRLRAAQRPPLTVAEDAPPYRAGETTDATEHAAGDAEMPQNEESEQGDR